LAGKKHGRYALDSYALLAFFEGEEGQEQVAELLREAERGICELFLNVVNLGEIAYIVERERGLPQAQITLARIDELPIEIIEVDRRLALAAAHIKARYPIAYADCFAAALALENEAALVTGDPEFKGPCRDSGIEIIWID
jgi:predicted nucleic acid-binding protein